uniref:bifunctional aspartate kinase/homoserine dehydrogenase II n=1 Tax=Thaumasiovibrio occultus TaxID=1891184 RepID=UPI000B35BDD9|nr:bifunctional aspartate kinase/homoserine dehydrogenase II [Thaumasiovibrio occultus]
MAQRQLHKFGGSSLADAECYRRVAEILANYASSHDLVVVSAAGTTTNQLIEILNEKDGRLAHEALMALREFQQGLITDLVGDEALVEQLYIDCRDIAQAAETTCVAERSKFLGYGEVWSARLLAAYLTRVEQPAIMLDSRQLLRAERAAQPEVDSAASFPLMQECLAQYTKTKLVITGFMAQNAAEETVLLGRNGSDYSATILGALANVSRVTIWSDVAGVYSADPRVVPEACLLPLLRLDEANELARLAAPVLHTRTLQPVSQSTLDLNLRCALAPESGITRVERVLASGRGAKIVTSLPAVSVLELTLTKGANFAAQWQEIESDLQRHQLQALAATTLGDQGVVQLAYTEEVVGSVMTMLQHSGMGVEMRLREGFYLVAAVGAGVTNNPNHCHSFQQQLKTLPVEFVEESQDGLSIAAIVRGDLPADLLEQLHATLFQAQKTVGIALFGNGNIGSRWLSLFAEQQTEMSRRYGKRFTLVGVIDSKSAWICEEGIDPAQVEGEFKQQASGYRASHVLSELAGLPYDEMVVMDVTASSELASQYADIAELGMHLVTANKIAGSAPSQEYDKVVDAFAKTGRHWLYNATVGAGLPINYTIRDLVDSGDSVFSLSGIFSGTLSWLFEQFDGSIPFTTLVDLAWQQGLTEPDPRADLDGSDVMRKLVILAREAGLPLEPTQVKVESLVPEELASVDVDTFLEQGDALNEALAERLAKAVKHDKVLRYVARLGKDGKAYVGIESLERHDPLANLLPCDNIFAIESIWYKDNPLVIRGPGAGRDVTAGALQSDLNRLASVL